MHMMMSRLFILYKMKLWQIVFLAFICSEKWQTIPLFFMLFVLSMCHINSSNYSLFFSFQLWMQWCEVIVWLFYISLSSVSMQLRSSFNKAFSIKKGSKTYSDIEEIATPDSSAPNSPKMPHEGGEGGDGMLPCLKTSASATSSVWVHKHRLHRTAQQRSFRLCKFLIRALWLFPGSWKVQKRETARKAPYQSCAQSSGWKRGNWQIFDLKP